MIGNILHTFGNKLLMAAISVVLLLLYTNHLGAEGLGSIGLIVLNITLVQLICNLSNGSIVYFSQKLNLGKLVMVCYLWTGLSIGLFYGINQFYPLADERYMNDIYRLSVLAALLSIYQYVLLGQERIKDVNRLTLLQSMLTLAGITYFFLIEGRNEVSAFIDTLYAAYLICLVLGWIFTRKYIYTVVDFKGPSFWQTFREAFHYGFFIQTANAFQMLNYRLSYFILDAFTGRAALGVYTAGVRISEGLILPGRSIATVQYARISNKDHDPYAQRITVLLTKLSMGITLVGVLILLLLPSTLYNALFGEAFSDVKAVIVILSMGILMQSAEIIISHYFSGTGRQQINSLSAMIGLFITVVAGFALIPLYGAKGAALTALLSYTGMFAFLFVQMIRKSAVAPLHFLPQKGDVRLLKRLWRKFLK